MNKALIIFLSLVVIVIVVWLIVKPKGEHFGGGHSGGMHGGGGFHGGGRHFSYGRGGRRFYSGWGPGSYYDWDYYYPYWSSYSDDVRNCIINNVNSCGNTKECYDRAINVCT